MIKKSKFIFALFLTMNTLVLSMASAEVYNHEFESGWHLLSFPCEMTTSDPVELFSSGYEEVYGIEDETMKYYKELSTAGAGLGYWAYFGSATETVMNCNTVTEPTFEIELNSGWNIIGSPYETTRWSESTMDGESVTSSSKIDTSLFEYINESGEYKETNIMKNWNGYIVKTNNQGTLAMSSLSSNNPPVADTGQNKNCISGKFYEYVGTEEGGDGLVPVFDQHDITCELDGSGSSDTDGDYLTYSWTKLSGPDVEIAYGTSEFASFFPGESATYTFQLEVNDGFVSATDTLVVSSKKLTGKIVYVQMSVTADIYTMDLEDTTGNGLSRISDHSGSENTPHWATDGARIVFDSNRDGDRDIYIINSDGTGITNITNNSVTDINPDWSVNNRIVFVSDRNGAQEVFDMDTEGNDVRQFTSIGRTSYIPEYSFDGEYVEFKTDYGSDNYEIYVVDKDGNNLNRLTDDTKIQNGAWTNDVRILYTEREDYLTPERLQVMDIDGSNIQLWPTPEGVTEFSTQEMTSDGEFIFYKGEDGKVHVMLSDGSEDVNLGVSGTHVDYHPGQ